ncbi:hypothetical protein GQ53DRAFT_876784 [Thozetella sp. PMI_491]|nr:hypothetical protein GQ53DRAFT_876784 [Thozetella sp. PMI_491]
MSGLPAKYNQQRSFGTSLSHWAVKPYLLADIGEGITECQIISWSVKPGDEVQQFDPICEVQSDKASVEITSRYDGKITALHHDAGDMAQVGSVSVDQEITHDVSLVETTSKSSQLSNRTPDISRIGSGRVETEDDTALASPKNSGLVSPAVRHLLKENNIDLANIEGTGKDGRVLKEDAIRYIQAQALPTDPGISIPDSGLEGQDGQDHRTALSPIQDQMFQTMTRSLTIPHFLYTHSVDFTSVEGLRARLASDRSITSFLQHGSDATPKLTPLPFMMKALSQALSAFPTLNSVLDTEGDSGKPQLILKSAHNIGLAVDTPRGLLVPVIRNVQNHSVLSLAAEISRVCALAKAGKLAPQDMKGYTIVVSNIGSIGGHVVAPVILSPTTVIVAVGKIEPVPVFQQDESGNERIVKRHRGVLSWSADHRVHDGATVARCAQHVGSWLENIGELAVALK